MDALTTCVGCGGAVPDVDGPTHPYMVASPGCWARYGEWMAGLAASPPAAPVVAVYVDCYAVQHPDGAEHDRRQRQSVAVHLVTLCRLLELGHTPRHAVSPRGRVSETVLPALGLEDWPLLDPPADRGATTLADVVAVADAGGDLGEVVQRWAEDVWQAWSAHHATVRRWADALEGGR